MFGKDTGFASTLELSTINGSNGFVLNGIDGGDRLGSSVSKAGDVNADGIDDLIIGAFTADPNGNRDAGESYVFFGVCTAPKITTQHFCEAIVAKDDVLVSLANGAAFDSL